MSPCAPGESLLGCHSARAIAGKPRPSIRRSPRSHRTPAAYGQSNTDKSLFLFGLGYSGAAIARFAQLQGWRVYSACRRPDKYQQLESSTHRLVAFDPAGGQQLRDEDLNVLASCCAVVTTIPPIAAKLYDPVVRAQLKAVAAGAAASSSQLRWVGYLSSTGVYGNWQGGWVSEDAPPRTTTARGLLRLEAEGAWTAAAQEAGLGITLLRLGGIYGPRRSIIESLNKDPSQLSSSKQRRGQQKYISRCHVADIAAAVVGTLELRIKQDNEEQQQQDMQQQQQHAIDILNVVDDEPTPRAQVEAFAAQLLQLVPPSSSDPAVDPGCVDAAALPQAGEAPAAPQQQLTGSTGGDASDTAGGTRSTARSSAMEEKRVSNARLKHRLAQLGWGLAAPSYRQGLQRIAAGDTSPFAPEDLRVLFEA